jgi:hypothetical protein
MADDLRVDISDLRPLIKDLNFFDKTSGRRVGAAMRKAADVIKNDAKARASWSSRIPNTIKVTGGVKAVYIQSAPAGSNAAPHAYYYEQGHGDRANPTQFSHLLFGKRVKNKTRNNVAPNGYILQPTRPYLLPARDAHLTEFAEALADAIADAITKGA